MLIHVKMPKIDGISTLISMTNTTSESLKARKTIVLAFRFSFAVDISCSVRLSMNKLYKGVGEVKLHATNIQNNGIHHIFTFR